jgi:hypothetical protein
MVSSGAVSIVACKEDGGSGSKSTIDGGGSGVDGGSTGGSSNTGGGSATGGSTATGGSNATGGSSGASANGGAGGSTNFVAASPPADVCALLTLTDVQTILPGAGAGAPEPVADTPDTWSRICKWKASGIASVDLVVFGAKTEQGLQALTIMATTGPGNGPKTPVTGLGDRAVYWENSGINTRGLTAQKGSYSADVTAYFVDPAPTQAQLTPLVQQALDHL